MLKNSMGESNSKFSSNKQLKIITGIIVIFAAIGILNNIRPVEQTDALFRTSKTSKVTLTVTEDVYSISVAEYTYSSDDLQVLIYDIGDSESIPDDVYKLEK